MPAPHPTARRLLETVVTLLDSDPPERITVDLVLSTAGVSVGSMYHHYDDLQDLIRAAVVERVRLNVTRDVEAIARVMERAHDRPSLMAGLAEVTRASQSPERMGARVERARTLAMAAADEALRVRLAVEQQRLTQAVIELFAEGQRRGWLSADVDTHAAAVFIQAYSLGRLVDDLSGDPMSHEAWLALIDRVADRVF